MNSNVKAVKFSVKFKKRKMPEVSSKHGMFRGIGIVSVDNSGVIINGSHVYPEWIRFIIGLIIFLTMVIALGIFGLLPFLIIYFSIEHMILKKEKVEIPWFRMKRFAINQKKGVMGFRFQGPAWTSPVIISSQHINLVAEEFRKYRPDLEVVI